MGKNFSIRNSELIIPQTPNGKTNSAGLYFDFSTILVTKLKIKFDYQLTGKGNITFCGRKSSLSTNAKSFEKEMPASENGAGSIIFSCTGEKGLLKIKNLIVTPIKPANVVGKFLILDKKRAKAIYYAKTDLKHTFLDQRAADILQKELYIAGGGVLPVKVLENNHRVSNGIIVGQAAKNYIDFKNINKVGDGGYILKVSKGIAAIYSKDSYANIGGIFAFLKKLGFFYLTSTEYIAPTGEELESNNLLEIRTPAVAWRLDSWRGGNSRAIGMSDPICMSDLSITGKYRGWEHTMPFFIKWEEFKNSNLNFFAMQSDGIRHPGRRASDVHYCYTNKKLQKLMSKRIVDIFNSDPIGKFLFVVPGDGMDYFCRCKECKKLGSSTDNLIYFLNIIAREVKKTHPDVIILSAVYTDSRKAPLTQKPESNIIMLYCPYEPGWLNHLQTHHHDNALGWKELKEWLKTCPNNMGAYLYPSSCTECFNLWPSFYANYEKIKFFAKNGFKVIKFNNLSPGWGIFNAVQKYVLTKVLWNPDIDVEKEIDDFLKLYYGKAAPALRKFFDLIHAEIKRRDWSQNTEIVIRGFVTQKLADQGMKLFAEAENVVKNEKIYKDRIQREKLCLLWSYLTDINRANGKLKPNNFPSYAQRMSEFCKLAKKFKINYLGRRLPVKKWFWDTAMIKISGEKLWYNESVITELIANPQKILGATIPRTQIKTNYGYMIPAQGILGGKSIKSAWLRSKPARIKQLYRQSSGFGAVKMILNLNKKPSQAVLIKVKGIDNEKKGIALMQLLVNGKSIYKGKVPWGKQDWSEKVFKAPTKFWVKGDNVIQFLNITPDKDVFSQGRAVKRNYFWGWYIIEKCSFYIK